MRIATPPWLEMYRLERAIRRTDPELAALFDSWNRGEQATTPARHHTVRRRARCMLSALAVMVACELLAVSEVASAEAVVTAFLAAVTAAAFGAAVVTLRPRRRREPAMRIARSRGFSSARKMIGPA